MRGERIVPRTTKKHNTKNKNRQGKIGSIKLPNTCQSSAARNPPVRKKVGVFRGKKQQFYVEGKGRKESSFCFVSPTDY